MGGKGGYAAYRNEETGPSPYSKTSQLELFSNAGLMDIAGLIGLRSNKALVLDMALDLDKALDFE